MEGKQGTVGCSGHYDWCGYERIRTWLDDYPEWLIQIIKFRNENLQREWLGSLEHDVTGSSDEECRIKGRQLVSRVNQKLDLLKEKYGEFDSALDELEKYYKNENR